MKVTATKTVSAVLLLSMLTGTLTACGGSDVPTQDTSAANTVEDTTAPSPTYTLPEQADYQGQTFTVLAAANRSEVFESEQTGDIVDDAIYKRNLKTEEHLGIDLQYVLKDSDWRVAAEFTATITSAIMSGDDTYDLMTGAMTVIPKLAQDNLFLNLLDLPIDLNNPWWVSGLTDTAAINGKLYALAGDLSLTLYNAAAVIYFNDTLRQNFNLPNFYDQVREGKWTVDTFLSATKDVTADLNNDGSIDMENDRIGVLYHGTPFATLQASTDMNIFNNEGGKLAYHGMPEKMADLYDKLMTYKATDTLLSFSNEYEVGANVLAEDRALFYMCTIRVTSALRNMKSDYGILPFPKYDENQEDYIADVSQSTVLWSIPVTAKDSSLSSAVCEVLAYYNRELLIPAYYDVSLSEKYSRDADTKEMLQIVRDSLRLTPDGYLNHCFSPTPFNTFTNVIGNGTAPASYFASNEAAWQSQLEAIIKAYQNQ